ncbi:MAG: transcription antitermination factor NusB [Oscillospiraceae bacterium]|nr:transcription antitermination factor NusB [Oscillospiraceae bacterium]
MGITRHDIRESEFIFIFEKAFRDESPAELIEISKDNEAVTVNEEVISTVEGVYEHLEEIDAIISQFSTKRSLERIPKLNLAALRLAVYEIKYLSDRIPIKVSINEAVGLVNKYAQETDVAFVNGVLGTYSRSLEAGSLT